MTANLLINSFALVCLSFLAVVAAIGQAFFVSNAGKNPVPNECGISTELWDEVLGWVGWMVGAVRCGGSHHVPAANTTFVV